MRRALIVDPFSGASGDMFLGALVDVGVPFDVLRDTLLHIPVLSKLTIQREKVARGVIDSTRITIRCPKESSHRSLSTIREIIGTAELSDAVKEGAVRTFTLLAEAEAKVHGQDVEKVHFHEVGALDAICDIVGTHVALDLLGGPVGLTKPIMLGSGSTKSAHGEIPLPAPATLELLGGHKLRFTDRLEELVTPTGAAIIASRFDPIESHTIATPDRIGYGAGTREGKGMPNVLRVILGAIEEGPHHVCIVTSTIDDMNPEVYGFLMERLFERGALEVYYNSIMMKKNRPGLELTLIAEERDVYALSSFLMSETTTLGVRIHREERMELERRRETVATGFGDIQVKVAARPGGDETMSPEYESCKAAAERANVGLLAVYDAARKAWDARKRG